MKGNEMKGAGTFFEGDIVQVRGKFPPTNEPRPRSRERLHFQREISHSLDGRRRDGSDHHQVAYTQRPSSMVGTSKANTPTAQYQSATNMLTAASSTISDQIHCLTAA